MDNYQVIKRIRFSEDDIKHIIESTIPIRIDTAIGKDNVVFKDVNFSGLEIIKSKFKSSLSFINCVFESPVILNKVSSESEISFNKCIFDKGVLLFNCNSNHISFSGCSLGSHITFDSTECQKISIYKVECSAIYVLSSIRSTKIKEIELSEAVVNDVIKIEEIHNAHRISFDSINASVIRYDSMLLTTSSEIKMSNINCDDLRFENSKLEVNSHIQVLQSQIKNLLYRNMVFNRGCKVLIESNLIEGKLFIQQSVYNNCSIDFSTSDITHLSLDPELLKFLYDSNKITPIMSTDMPLERQIETLKKLKSKFSGDSLYESEDIVFFFMKNKEYSYFLKSPENSISKLKYLFFYIFGRYCFGWGVKLKQPLITSMAVIIIFSMIYYFIYDMSSFVNKINFLQVDYTGSFGAVLMSTVTFFGQYTDIETELALNAILHITEFILGVLYITLLVGILIRKLVR
ncbi:hypothetical protein NJD71_01455 [Psychrobacter sp. PP-21]|uniref:hypothetical protein n=1 Tax=Psychrobacter sp. PP-21 TaxID=2957503 RepID=UPI0029A8084A|nr:hypothetical protein [Psychrobacter sp. PP-21]MDX2372789.1 hypothetical protein [Psychrobacter sp. PP-21]